MKRLCQTGLNFLFDGLFLAFSLVGIPVLALFVACLSPFLSRRQVLRRVRRAISWYGKVVIFILPFPWIRVRYRDFGKDDGPGPFLYVCNHRSSSDPFMMACLPGECVQVVNIWPFRLPALGLAAKLAGYLSVRQMPPELFMSRV